MRQSANNSFKDGMNLDLHPLVTPDSVLTDNLNGTFITYDGNEFCLQNDRGNKYVDSLSPGFTPIGAKEFNGVIYIVSTNNENTEIGIYPGFQINKETNEVFREGKLNYKKYTPLRLIDAPKPEP